MAIATILFWSNNCKSHGVPNVFYSYLISVSKNQVIGSQDKIVKITPMTIDTPKPVKEGAIIIRNIEENDALEATFRIIEKMDCLQGLNKYRSIVESTEKNQIPETVISFKENWLNSVPYNRTINYHIYLKVVLGNRKLHLSIIQVI